MTLSICTYGNPVLRQKATEVIEITDEIRLLVEDMLATMYRERGLGLAAEQVGRTERLVIIDIPADSDLNADNERDNPDVKMPLVMINPRLLDHNDYIQVGQEGCLSFPDIFVQVDRWHEVDAEYMDLDGVLQTVHAKGLLARAVQHELNHLDGILLVDHMSHVKKVAVSGKLKRLVKENKARL